MQIFKDSYKDLCNGRYFELSYTKNVDVDFKQQQLGIIAMNFNASLAIPLTVSIYMAVQR